MSFWGREASARRGRCRTTHLCGSGLHLPCSTVCHRPAPSASPGPFPPSLLLLKAIEGRERSIWENTPYSAAFGKGGEGPDVFLRPLAGIGFIQLPLRQLLTQFIFSVSQVRL